MFLHIENIQCLKDYKLRLTFDNGIQKDVDLENELYGEIFKPLRDKSVFKKVFLNPESKPLSGQTEQIVRPSFYTISESRLKNQLNMFILLNTR